LQPGLIFWLVGKSGSGLDLRLRDGFLVVALFWLVLGIAGAAPLAMSDSLNISFTDAVFESISGLTTTGATILSGLDDMPPSILFYRQMLQWLGGMGIIVLAVAVLPMLGVGGMQLYRAETPGPVKDTKLTPRITDTAKALYFIYAGITIACFAGYWIAGMNWFDALGHAFSTVSTGGFSTHDASLGYFAQNGFPHAFAIEMVAVVFMLAGAVSFPLHFLAWKSRNLKGYREDPEFRALIAITVTVSAITIFYLFLTGTYSGMGESFRKGLFHTVSIGTSTGFTTAKHSLWPGSLPVMLLLFSFVGGCAGSTGGGMKVIRWLLLYKQGAREVRRLIHPNAEIPVKLGNSAVPTRVIEAVWGFFSIYIIVFAIMMLLLMATGLDQDTAFSAIATTMNNLGPGLAKVSENFITIPDTAKWISVFAMLLGRLEIFTLLVLFTPSFWDR